MAKKVVILSCPKEKSLEATKAWISEVTFRLTGKNNPNSMTEEPWAARKYPAFCPTREYEVSAFWAAIAKILTVSTHYILLSRSIKPMRTAAIIENITIIKHELENLFSRGVMM